MYFPVSYLFQVLVQRSLRLVCSFKWNRRASCSVSSSRPFGGIDWKFTQLSSWSGAPRMAQTSATWVSWRLFTFCLWLLGGASRVGCVPGEALTPRDEVNCLLSHFRQPMRGECGILGCLPPKPVPLPPGHLILPGKGEARCSSSLGWAG